MRSFATKRMLVAFSTVLIAACGGTASNNTPAGTASPVDVGSGNITGAGATFPEPFYTKAFYTYSQQYSAVTVNYQAIGSGGGITQFTKGTVDFGASDVPMNATEVAAAGGADALVQFPTTLGVISVAYNLSGVQKLQLDGPTIAGIFLGRITTWNDPAIAALNSGVSLPSTAITVVHRSDASGTTFGFTDYLSKVSDTWKTKVGNSKAVQWPTGVGGNGNAGVGQGVKSTDGAIGYVELAYVIQSSLQQAYVKNHDGKFLQASLDGASAAAATHPDVSATNFSITDSTGPTSYPITTFSWVIVKKTQTDAGKAKALLNLWKWVVTTGQAQGKDLQYAPLPAPVATLAIATLKSVTANGAPVLK